MSTRHTRTNKLLSLITIILSLSSLFITSPTLAVSWDYTQPVWNEGELWSDEIFPPGGPERDSYTQGQYWNLASSYRPPGEDWTGSTQHRVHYQSSRGSRWPETGYWLYWPFNWWTMGLGFEPNWTNAYFGTFQWHGLPVSEHDYQYSCYSANFWHGQIKTRFGYEIPSVLQGKIPNVIIVDVTSAYSDDIMAYQLNGKPPEQGQSWLLNHKGQLVFDLGGYLLPEGRLEVSLTIPQSLSSLPWYGPCSRRRDKYLLFTPRLPKLDLSIGSQYNEIRDALPACSDIPVRVYAALGSDDLPSINIPESGLKLKIEVRDIVSGQIVYTSDEHLNNPVRVRRDFNPVLEPALPDTLPENDNRDNTFVFKINLPQGRYEIKAIVDSSQSLIERFETNNESAILKFTTEGESVCAPPENLGQSCYMITIGSSVNLSNGNLYDDIQLTNSSGSNLTTNISASYNSQDPSSEPLGNGWTHNYNLNLVDSGNTIILIDEDGTRIRYIDEDIDRIYTPEPRFGDHSTIVKNTDSTYTLTRKYGVRYYFNTIGQLTRIEDRSTNIQTFTYTDGNLTQITDSAARITTLTYNTANQITNITDPAGRVTEVYYDTNGNLTQIKNPSGTSWFYTYNSQNRLITKQDPEANLYQYTYDEQGRLISATDPDNNRTKLQYDTENNQAIVQDPLTNQTTYTYDKPLNVWTSITDPLGNTVTNTWDEDGNNLTTTDANNNTTAHTYDTKGNLLTTTDTSGNTTTYTYEPVHNQILTETDPLGNTTTYEYDTKANRTKTIDALNHTTEYTYDTRGNLLNLKDALGNISTSTYDRYSNLSSTTDALGNTTTYTYDITGNLITTQDAKGNTTQYEYDTGDRLLKVSLQAISTTYTYDANGNRTTITDTSGNTTQYQYDSQNRLIKLTDPQGNETTYTYDANDNRLSTKDPEGNIATSTYDIANRLIMTTDSLGNTTSYTYDPSGNRTQIIDPEGNTTTYTYNNLNQLISTQDPQGNLTTYTYDSVGRVLSSTLLGEGGGEGSTTTYTYDALGRTTSIHDPEGNLTSYTYDAIGNRTSSTDPQARTTHYTYDAVGKTVSTRDPEGNTTRYEYDSLGNLIATEDPQANRTQYEYDSLNRLITIIDSTGGRTTYTYDPVGNRISVTDPQGRTTRFEYDKNNRITAIIDPTGSRTEYTYDRRGNRITVKDALGRPTKYEYDSLNRLIAIIEPGGALTTYTYDKRGNLTSKRDPNGNTITYGYDSLGNVVKKTFPDGVIYTFTYDAEGNILTEHVDGNLQYQFTYDKLNHLTTRTITDKGTIGYTYDAVGNPVTFTDQQNGIVRYTYDKANRPLSTTDPEGRTTTYTYDSLGRRTRRTYPNGVSTTYTYDPRSQLVTIDNLDPKNKTISSYTYTYDPSGNRLSMLEQNGKPETTTTYTYDIKSQLTGVQVIEKKSKKQEEQYSVAFTYDIVGNRISMQLDTPKDESLPFHEYAPTLDHQPQLKHPLRAEYTYNSIDQLLTETGYRTNKPEKQYYKTDYTYDPNGNITGKVLTKSEDDDDEEDGMFNTSYEYDYQNLLKKITYPDTTTNTFINCRCGSFRHQKVDSQGLTNYLYDKYNTSPIFETDETYKPKARYTKGPWIDELISRTVYEYEDDDDDEEEEEGEDDNSSSVSVESKTYYYLYDGLGSVRQLVDEKGKVVTEYDYLPFGEIIESKHGESRKNPFTYTGKPYDQDSGLYYNQARYNDSRIGRFTTQDPLLRQPSRTSQSIQPFTRSSSCQTCGTTPAIQTIPVSRTNQNISTIPEHPYVYVRNNPVNFTDPTGLAAICSGKVGRCKRPLSYPPLPESVTIGGRTIEFPDWIIATVNQALGISHHDVKIIGYSNLNCEGAELETEIKGFFAKDRAQAGMEYALSLLPFSTVTGWVPGTTGLERPPGPCPKLTCVSKEKYEKIKKRMINFNPTQYHLTLFNCQNWAGVVLQGME